MPNTITLIDPTDGGVMEVPIKDAHGNFPDTWQAYENVSFCIRKGWADGSYYAALWLAHCAFSDNPELRED